jgi:hypothetical protein
MPTSPGSTALRSSKEPRDPRRWHHLFLSRQGNDSGHVEVSFNRAGGSGLAFQHWIPLDPCRSRIAARRGGVLRTAPLLAYRDDVIRGRVLPLGVHDMSASAGRVWNSIRRYEPAFIGAWHSSGHAHG